MRIQTTGCAIFLMILVSRNLTSLQDDEWDDEEKLIQGMKDEEYAFLSGRPRCPLTRMPHSQIPDMLGPRGTAFDADDIHDAFDDDDLKNDPISQMDMTVSTPCIRFHTTPCCGLTMEMLGWCHWYNGADRNKFIRPI